MENDRLRVMLNAPEFRRKAEAIIRKAVRETAQRMFRLCPVCGGQRWSDEWRCKDCGFNPEGDR